jgi:hypothetical protein
MTPQLCQSSEHGAKYQSQGSTSGHSHTEGTGLRCRGDNPDGTGTHEPGVEV